MPATVTSASIIGINAEIVQVEADVLSGLPSITVVGLPDTAIQESRERTRSAVRNSGFHFPLQRITFNLSPADRRKEGSGFDLPTALALLMTTEQIPRTLDDCLVVGELTLTGECRGIPGAIAYAELASRSNLILVLPEANAAEAALIPGVRLRPVKSLLEVVEQINREHWVTKKIPPPAAGPKNTWNVWPAIRGQSIGKRAATIAAAGGHNLLLIGPPGVGKTMIAEALSELLPNLNDADAVEVTKIHSIAGLRRPADPLIRRPPFRHPHHGVSVAALVGGGRQPRPGELTLAHRGILFLDELPEFSRDHLESLRQPIERGTVSVSRVAGSAEFPAQVMVIAAMNPCPCGYFSDRTHDCHCTPYAIQRYQQRISGPLLDRFDLFVYLARVTSQEYKTNQNDPRPLINQAQRFLISRGQTTPNAYLRGSDLTLACRLDQPAREFIQTALDQMQLSLRAHDRILRVARTIADLAEIESVKIEHLAEAIQYRPPSSLDLFRRKPAG